MTATSIKTSHKVFSPNPWSSSSSSSSSSSTPALTARLCSRSQLKPSLVNCRPPLDLWRHQTRNFHLPKVRSAMHRATQWARSNYRRGRRKGLSPGRGKEVGYGRRVTAVSEEMGNIVLMAQRRTVYSRDVRRYSVTHAHKKMFFCCCCKSLNY